MKNVQMVSVFRDSNGMRIGTIHSEIEGNKVVSNNIRRSYILTDPEDIALAESILARGQELIDGDPDA
ncbi:hypothetical protein [uncultured Dubosiella sp.]|uniref:hypothetical protein n=1 Tax=uncultured Dubosiella sp. TaxID=1937011 RepID=UPI0025B4BD4E|nr:hypothetical protein [uncultured Dubosiella sp.]